MLETLEPSSTVAETATSPRATLPNFAAALTRHFEQPVKTTRSIPLPKLPALKRAAISQPPQHRRIQLYWPQVTSDSPPRVSGHASHSLLLLSSGHHHDLPENREPSPRASAAMNVGSIFDALSDPTELEVLSTLMNDSRLEEWFTKKPNEHANKKSKVKVTNNGTTTAAGTKRPSVLGPAASQKYHITVHCIKKSTDAGSGWEGFKRSMRHCRLTKSQINLLLETVPDRETAQGTRKLHEWEDHVTKVEELIKKCPTEPLYEDEEFVRYIASIPDLHQRLQCMLIMESFPDLMKRINADIEVLMDAMEVLLKSPGIRRFFHAILLLGNHQNEGTNLGNRKWFRIGTLKRVIDYRGAGREAKSLLSLIAMHLGPVMSREEAALITKAAHISIVQVVQSATQTYDIFKLLSEQSTETPPTPLVLVNSADDVTSSDDTTDHFASVGHRFIEQNRTQFQELRQDIRRLLEDYHCCVTYFGDPEAFLPLDKKVDDERNPGQKRYIQDIFSVFHELWVALRPALRDADTMGKVKRPMQKPVISEPSLQSTPKLTKASTSPAATSIGESFTVQQKLPLSSQSPVSTSSPPDISVEETSLFSVDALSSTITSSATLRDSADAVKEPPHATLASPVDLPAPRQVIEPLSSSSGECSISSCEHLPRISEKRDDTCQADKAFKQHVSTLAISSSDIPADAPRRRASLRPALFDSDMNNQRLKDVVQTLEGIDELVDETDERDSSNLSKSSELAHHPTDLPTASHSLSVSPQKPADPARSTPIERLTLPRPVSTDAVDSQNVRRRRESLRAVAGFLSCIDTRSDDPVSVRPSLFSQSALDAYPEATENQHPSSTSILRTNSLLRSRPLLGSRLLSTARRSPTITSDSSASHSSSLLASSRIPRSSAVMAQSSLLAHSASLLGQRLAARRLASSITGTRLEPLSESPQEHQTLTEEDSTAANYEQN